MNSENFDLEQCKRAWDSQNSTVEDAAFFNESEVLGILHSNRRTRLQRRRAQCIWILLSALLALAASIVLLAWGIRESHPWCAVLAALPLLVSLRMTLVTAYELFLLAMMHRYRFRTTPMAVYATRFNHLTERRMRRLRFVRSAQPRQLHLPTSAIGWSRVAFATACLAALVCPAAWTLFGHQHSNADVLLANNDPAPAVQPAEVCRQHTPIRQAGASSAATAKIPHSVTPASTAKSDASATPAADLSSEAALETKAEAPSGEGTLVTTAEQNPGGKPKAEDMWASVHVMCNSGDCSVEKYCRMLQESLSHS